jgi:hypothetical protein
MSGVLLDRNGRPEVPEHLRHGFGKPEGAGPAVVGEWWNPELDVERELFRAPEHILDNLRKAAIDPHNSPRASGATWQETVNSQTTDGVAVTNTTTETIMVPNFVWPNSGPQALYVGKQVLWVLWGRVSTVVTTPGTITFRMRWGGVAGTLLVTSKAQRPKTTVSTNMAGWVQMEMTCRSIGSTGSVFSMGQCALANTIGDAQAAQESIWPDAPAAVTIDTTAASALTPTIQFSVATATTSWTTHLARLVSLN